MDLNILKSLKEYVVGAKKVARNIDADNVSFCYKNAPMIFDWKSEGFTIEHVLIADIFNWLCYLGLGDGYIADEEVEFINYCLDLHFTKEEIQELTISKLNKNFKDNLPVSFIFFCEAEIVHKSSMINHSAPIYSENLFGLFGVLGKSFIECDGECTFDEKNIYDEYMYLLWENLNDFKTRRGIDDTYNNLVGKDVDKKDITIKNNQSDCVSKLNLILKLVSQGYSIYELNNIVDLSIEIISKWFYKGKMGDKHFKEFYFKCIDLNHNFEKDIDAILEDIDIDNVQDDICVNKVRNNSLITSEKNLNSLLSDMTNLIGLNDIKIHLNSFISIIQIYRVRSAMGLKQQIIPLNLIVWGSSGTGKTTIVKLLSQIYYDIGLIENEYLGEVNLCDLIEDNIDQTISNMQKLIEDSIGSMLLININQDTILSNKEKSITEAINIISNALESYRNELIVFIEVSGNFTDGLLDYNNDLKNKINSILEFDDYSANELHQIFVKKLADSNLKLNFDSYNYFKSYIHNSYKNNKLTLTNGKAIERLSKKVIKNKHDLLKNKIEPSKEELETITLEDVINMFGEDKIVQSYISSFRNKQTKIKQMGSIDFLNFEVEQTYSSSNRVEYIYNSKKLLVEELVIEYYKNKGYFAIWAENDYWWVIYALLFWDIIFMKTNTCTTVPMNHPDFEYRYGLLGTQPMMDMPHDFFKPTFYSERKDKIDQCLKELLNSNISDLIKKSYYTHYGEYCRPIENWDKYTIDDLTVTSRLLSNKQIVSIMKHLVVDFNNNRSGFPDLIVFNNEEFFFVEVKSKNDTLHENQVQCINFLRNNANFDVIIFSVNKTNKQQDNLKKQYIKHSEK